jgi:5-methylcytosine-specific restriction enzyme A
MPSKPSKPCHKQGCPNLTKTKYCEVHQENEKVDKAVRDKYYDIHLRNAKVTSFYKSVSWQKTREIVKNRAKNLCEFHWNIKKEIVFADVCDHIIPIKTPEGWEKRLDLDGLQMLCHACHNAKTAEDKKKYNL